MFSSKNFRIVALSALFVPVLIFSAGCESGGNMSSSSVDSSSSGGGGGVDSSSTEEYNRSVPQAPDYSSNDSSALSGDTSTQGSSSTGKPANDTQEKRDVIRDATMVFLVDEVKEPTKATVAVATEQGGFVENLNVGEKQYNKSSSSSNSYQGYNGEEYYSKPYYAPNTIVIRVPSENYDKTLEELKTRVGGEVVSLSTNVEDVTGVALDLEARISAEQKSIKRITDFMNEANNVNELIAVEQELSTRQANLESLISQKENLEESVALTTITVTLVTPESAAVTLPKENHWWDQAARAFGESWNAIVVVLAALLPIALVAGVFVLIIVLLVRKFRKPKNDGLTLLEEPGETIEQVDTPAEETQE